jgi:hypothetical protein
MLAPGLLHTVHRSFWLRRISLVTELATNKSRWGNPVPATKGSLNLTKGEKRAQWVWTEVGGVVSPKISIGPSFSSAGRLQKAQVMLARISTRRGLEDFDRRCEVRETPGHVSSTWQKKRRKVCGKSFFLEAGSCQNFEKLSSPDPLAS